MKKLIPFILASATLLLVSCAKDNPAAPEPVRIKVPFVVQHGNAKLMYDQYDTIVEHNQAIYQIKFDQGLAFFTADRDSNLTNLKITIDDQIVVDRRLVNKAWLKSKDEILVPGVEIKIGEWIELFRNYIARPKTLLRHTHGPFVFDDNETEPRRWEVIGRLEDDPKFLVLRTEGNFDLKRVHETDFALLPRGDKPFYLVRRGGLLYPVVRTTGDPVLYAVEVSVEALESKREVASR